MHLQFKQTVLSRTATNITVKQNSTKASDRHKQHMCCAVSVLSALDNEFIAVSECPLGVAGKCERETAHSRCLMHAEFEVCKFEAVL
jgi:hypothetical protein